MTKEEYKELLTTIKIAIQMADVSREAKAEAKELVGQALVKKMENVKCK